MIDTQILNFSIACVVTVGLCLLIKYGLGE